MEKTAGNIAKIAIGSFMLSVIPGSLFASLFTTFKSGFSERKLATFDMFHFWSETPFVLGYASQDFNIIMIIFAASALVCTFGGVVLGFPNKLNSHGSAKWADPVQMKKLGYLKKYGEILGGVFAKTTLPKRSGLYFTNDDQPHCLVSAPTRAGKGVSVVIPTLLTFDGSIVALDVKEELFRDTSRARVQKGDKVFKFNPLAPDGRTHCYNPLDEIVTAEKHRRFTEARRLATNLIVAKNKGAESFIDGSRDLFAAGIMLAVEKKTPTIGAVYDLFSQPGEKQALFSRFAEETESREAKSIFNNMAGNDLKIITSYTSILDDGGLKLWADAFIRNATSRSDFNIKELRLNPATIYLCVSPNDLGTLAPLLRLLFQQIVASLQNKLPSGKEVFEVLFLMDEFKSLGQLAAIETAITTIAGYGGRFMFIVQSLANITGLYGREGKENILANCGVQAFMATTDAETPEYLSRAIGDFTRKSRTKSWNTRELTGSTVQEREEGMRLIRPEEIRLLSDDDMLILVRGQDPLKLKKVRYYEDKVLRKIFEDQKGSYPDPTVNDVVSTSERSGFFSDSNNLNDSPEVVSDEEKAELEHNKIALKKNESVFASLAEARKIMGV